MNTKTDLERQVIEKTADALIPGLMVEFDPLEAELAGAFAEDALSEDDAKASAIDVMDTKNFGGDHG